MTALTERPAAARPAPREIPPTAPDAPPPSGVLGRLRAHLRSILAAASMLLVGAAAMLVNLGGSPQRIDDEGTYTAQAWSVFNLGEITHYTYWYDHPPVGWLQLAGYAELTGAWDRYDIAVLAAREAVVVATLIAGALLFAIARRIGLGRIAASGATLLFVLSPLAVQFHRTVYLDNVATPWLLAAILLVMNRRHQLAAYTGAAVAFGIAVLTKETYLLALPLIIWLVLRSAHRATRRYTLSVAGSVLGLIGFSYVLLALVKGELMPGDDRVSLFEGLAFQLATREASGSPFDPGSLMSATLGQWWQLDAVFIAASLLSAVVAVRMRALRPFAVVLLGLALFMFRPGGYLPVPYVIMLLPIGALLVAAVAERAVRALRQPGRARAAGVAGTAVVLVAAVVATPLWFGQLRGLLLADLDAPMRDAEQWLGDNAPADSRLIVDDAMWVGLVEAGRARENVVWYYKLDTDPAVAAQSPNGWRDSDYVITTESMRSFPDSFPEVSAAIENSVVVARFGSGDQSVDVRRILPQGIDQALTEAEVAAARSVELGRQISTNPGLIAEGTATALLEEGSVDPSVVLGLGARLPDETIAISDFPAAPGESGLRRQVLVTAVDGEPVAADGARTARGDAFVDSFSGAFIPESARVVDGGLLLTFPVPASPQPLD